MKCYYDFPSQGFVMSENWTLFQSYRDAWSKWLGARRKADEFYCSRSVGNSLRKYRSKPGQKGRDSPRKFLSNRPGLVAIATFNWLIPASLRFWISLLVGRGKTTQGPGALCVALQGTSLPREPGYPLHLRLSPPPQSNPLFET